MEMLRNVLRNSLRKPVTRRYPQEAYSPHPDARGQLSMNPDVCIYCSVCEKRCPTGAITVTRKPGKSWTLRPHQCILCGYCIEVCPKKCMFMNPAHRGPTA
jgi:ech hydrogenase subunit F